MPLFNSFSESAARGLGVGSGRIMPPDVPVIVTPTGGSTLTTTTTAEVTFTSIATTYPILKYQYKVNVGGTFVDVSTSPFTITGLSEGTSYNIYMKAIDITNAESDITAARSFTTQSTVQIQAPTPILSSPSVTHPATITINVTYSAGVASGGYSMSTRQYALKSIEGQPSAGSTDWATLTGSSGTVPATQTTGTSPVNLSTSTPYYVYFKYTDTNGAISYTTNSITTAAENSPGIPAASTFTKTGTSTATLERGDSTKGTYNVAYQYRYWESNSSGTTAAPAEGWAPMTSNPTYLTGLNVNAYYDAQVRAVNVSPGTQVSSPRDYSIIQTDPGAVTAPSFTSSGMSSTSTGTITAVIPLSGYATKAYVEVSTSSNFFGATTYNSVSHPSTVSYDGANNRWVFSLGGQAYNSTYYYRAYVRNRIDGESSYSSTITWVTPKKGQTYFNNARAAEWRLAATNSILEPACPSPYAGVTFGFVPASDNTVGYVNIQYVGVQLRSGDSGFANTVTNYLYFSYPGGTTATSLAANTDVGYTDRVDTLPGGGIGGSALSGGTIALNFLWSQTNAPTYVNSTQYYTGDKVFYGSQNYQAKSNTRYNVPTNTSFWTAGVTYNPPGSAARISSYCAPNGSNWFWAANFYIQGTQTIGGTITG